ncbi:GNAT family N-acetyltransferase [Ruminococcus albus]|uniref:Acetyltransferase (GNAT) family protein n=1 Tax=Ruminococcus albus TaxID=1264 RepID=A0A1H7KPX9_RUMAL|nr:GNAT family N-acetyltransferase [Ruminococcus albus]SEK88822.1 Acetyltransferase (GNAT) family protein [Ruminococcus albus]
MAEIEIKTKDDNITLDEVNAVIEKSFTVAMKQEKMEFATVKFDKKEFQKLTEEAKLTCFVAMDGNKVVGTMTYTLVDWKRWYQNGKAPKLRYMAVLPEYSGRHIATNLAEAVKLYAQDQGYNLLFLSTPSKNKIAQKMYKKLGFSKLRYKIVSGHGVIEMGYWKNGCPYSEAKVKHEYFRSVLITFPLVQYISKIKLKFKRLIGGDKGGN